MKGISRMRIIHTDEIKTAISQMCISANCNLSQDVSDALHLAQKNENSPIGSAILSQLVQNGEIAKQKQMPICQDTGMAVVFMDIGQDVHITGQLLEDAVNDGVREGYANGFLRKSVVGDPLLRVNTRDNTPAVLHTRIVAGENIEITVAPKGFGSENMSRVYMLKPSDGMEGVKSAILQTVMDAGPNACPPMIVGVGIGGTFEYCAILAKRGLLRPVGSFSPTPYIREMEQELLTKMNQSGIGPQGLGGRTTVLGVHIETFPTHIAGLPVAINISCHVTRHETRIL